MKKHFLLPVLFLLGLAQGSFAQNLQPKTQPRPNVVVIFTDDLDWDEGASLASMSERARGGIKVEGNKKVLIPTIDNLLKESLLSTQFRVASTVCTPSRYALLTGQIPSRALSLQRRFPFNTTPGVEFNTAAPRFRRIQDRADAGWQRDFSASNGQ